ncbi:hypothetical protein GCM10029978_060910 [Actinoallomurus acanthiterrae]
MSASRRDRPERAHGRRLDESDEDYAAEYEDAYEEDEPEARPRRRRAASRLPAAEAAKAALREITALTGKSAEGVTSVRPAEDGWVAGVELLEARRIPSSSDTLALYEVEIDDGGDLTSYRRIQRYPRGRSEAS